MSVMRWLLVVVGSVLVAGSAQASWRQWRQGPTKEALAPQPLPITKPGLRWRFSTGGAPSQVVVSELDGDGLADLLSIEGGRVLARTASGALLWDTPPLQAVQLVRVEDLGGGVVVLVRTKRTAAILDAPTGALLWQSPPSLAVDLWAVQVADVQGDGTPEVAIVDNSINVGTDATVTVFTFPDGPASGVPLAHTGKDCEGEPGRIFALADVDGDGKKDVVHSGRTRLCVWSATEDEALLGQSDVVPDPMSVGEVLAADVDADGKDEIFVFTDWALVDKPSRRVYAFAWDGEGLRLSWSRSAAVPKDDRHTWPARPLVDVDGDERPEVLTSFWEGGAWSALALDALTGEPKGALPGRLLLDATDVDGDGAIELLAVPTTALKPPAYADKVLSRLTAAGGALTSTDVLQLPGSVVRLGPFPAPFSVGGDLVAARDVDGDSISDVLELRSLGAVLASATLGGPVNGIQVFASDGAASVAVLYASGEAAVLTSTPGGALALTNDADGDSHGDLTYGGFQARRVVGADDAGAPTLLVPASGGRLALLDASLGTPVAEPPTLLDIQANVTQVPFLVRLGPLGLGVGVLSRSASGAASLVVRSVGGASVSVTELGGEGGTLAFNLDPLIDDMDGDGIDEVYFLASDSGASVVTHRLIAVSALGGLRWAPVIIETPGANVGGVAALTVGPYAPAVLVTADTRRLAIGALTGELLHEGKAGVSHYYGQPVQTDLDGDGEDEVVILGTHLGSLALEPDLSFRWAATPGSATRGSGGVVSVAGGRILAQARTQDMALFFYDGSDGSELGVVALMGGVAVDPATLEPGTPTPAITDVVPVAALGDGVPGFLVAADDGVLYAIDAATREILWSHTLGGSLGTPALIDVDGDGDAEIAVPVGTGHLVIVDESLVDATAWVRENDGAGPALTDAADLDEQEAGDRIHVNWAPVTDASSFIVRVFSQNGTMLSERTVQAPATSTTSDGLLLVVGQTYTTGVSAVKVSVDTVTSSDEVSSDGVTIADLSPPSIAALVATPGVFSPDGDGFAETTTFSATAVDATRLASWELAVRHDGEVVRQWMGFVGKTSLELDVPWDGTDAQGAGLAAASYEVELRVLDTVGKEALAATQVTLCRPPFKEEMDACIGIRGPDAGAGADGGADAGGPGEDSGPGVEDGGSGDVPGVETTGGAIPGLDAIGETAEPAVDEGGCSCDQTGRPSAADAAPWLLLLALLGLRRRA